jgi:sugar phosphate isomerase/epimerase
MDGVGRVKIGCHVLQWGMGIDKKTRYTWDGRVWNIGLEQALDDIASLGFEGFDCESSDLALYATRPAAFLRMIAKKNLKYASTWYTLFPKELPPSARNTINPNISMSDPGQYLPLSINDFSDADVAKDLREKREHARLMHKLGASEITLGGPFFDRRHMQERHFRILGTYLNDLSEKLVKEFGMKTGLHHHLGTLVQDSADLERLYKYADKKIVGLCLDSAHAAAAGEDPVKFAKKYASRVVHAHLKDLASNGRFVELGEGELDLGGVLAALKDAGYEEWVMAELDIPTRSPLESARINKKFLDRAMRQLS